VGLTVLGCFVGYKRVLVHEFTRPRKFANYSLIRPITLRVGKYYSGETRELNWWWT